MTHRISRALSRTRWPAATCMQIMHANYACIRCMHNLRAYYACVLCMDLMHAYYACILCTHITHAMHIMHACMQACWKCTDGCAIARTWADYRGFFFSFFWFFQYASICFNMPQYASFWLNMLWYAAKCCNMPQRVSMCLNMLQYASICFDVLRCSSMRRHTFQYVAECWSYDNHRKRRFSNGIQCNSKQRSDSQQ